MSLERALIDLYVYYRVHAGDEHAHLAQAQTLLAGLRERHGVQGRLSRRPQAKDGMHTWMLSFTDLGASQEDAVMGALALPQHGPPIEGQRHVERFISPA